MWLRLEARATAAGADQRPLIAHLIHQLDVGGLENGLVHLINHLPPERYRHVIICMTNVTNFRTRILRPDVDIICLNKRAGKDWHHYLRLYQTLRRLQPQLMHTRNLATIEGQLLAAAAGVRLRVHGEHGRDMADLHGRQWRYRLLRRLLRPLIGQFIAVSQDLEGWLIDVIGVAPARVSRIANGVDSVQFHPRQGERALKGPPGFLCPHAYVIGSVGRMAEVKDYPTLVRAFLLLLQNECFGADRLRLLIVGDGPERALCLEMLRQAGVAHLAWLPGMRDDVATLMRAMDLFVLPSLAEGHSNTILEAMACGLPVVATEVGGNPSLVQPGRTGILVPPRAPAALAEAISHYLRMPELARRRGVHARDLVLKQYSLAAMTSAYQAVYDALCRPAVPYPPT